MTTNESITAPGYSPVTVDKAEIIFSSTADTQSFVIENTSNTMVFFKVQTTAADSYAVVPNMAFLVPKQSQNIHVTRAKQSGQPSSLRVGTIIVSDGSAADMDSVLIQWAEAKAALKARDGKDGEDSVDIKTSAPMMYIHRINVGENKSFNWFGKKG
ncbi:hypothetical protein BCR33DRAFT_714941 [Rhizoclosmatium globosum]|uniref:MSP domain-containing protein n=1 Tax=Rhizoclosmatium globosum TaxID=329046 RepID=A0A1Y2CLJ3_9FUNG|nr:hypothetical protein BCR33DRAFT_714941 [Rhizoclosmatium globosum]|eukprot:ORY47891.1 hypothetical protein BCR33DRAFT_714941 [Rhizoclosmatium globosum]